MEATCCDIHKYENIYSPCFRRIRTRRGCSRSRMRNSTMARFISVSNLIVLGLRIPTCKLSMKVSTPQLLSTFHMLLIGPGP